jgi:BirA family transcriptional regulator, biotin operon repressor / biotin---[acetyl-CoA-carboxylase] ligase
LIPWQVERHAEVGSTNDVALARGREGAPHGLVVVADAQTAGRGRQGRRWHSPKGDSLYLSALLRPSLAPSAVPPMTLAAAVAVCDAVNAFGAGASIKWPNDVLAGGRKLAGILTETSTRGDRLEAVVIGIGVNVGEITFPSEIPGTSVRADRETLLTGLLGELDQWVGRFLGGELPAVLEAWRARAGTIGARVTASGVRGVATGVDEHGALLITADTGDRLRVLAGEVIQEGIER